MKNLLLLVTGLTAATSLCAQNLQVGVPANRLLATGSYTGIGNCTTSDVTVQLHSDLLPLPTGLTAKLIITEFSAQAGSIHANPGGAIELGDTLDLNNNGISFLFMSSGYFAYEVRAIGTPTVAQQQYYCDSIATTVTLGQCDNGMVHYPYVVASNCAVEAASGLAEEQALQALQISQGAHQGQYQVRFPRPLAEGGVLEVLDQMGRSINRIQLSPQAAEAELNLQQHASGIYMLRLVSRNEHYTGKVVR